MSPVLANFLFEAVNFLLFALALSWFFFKPVRRALDQERTRHAAQEVSLEQQRAELAEANRAAQVARTEAERQGTLARDEVLAVAQREAAQILAGARGKLEAERRGLERELQGTLEEQAVKLVDTIGQLVARSVEQLLGALDAPALDTALVRAACAQLNRIPNVSESRALVESARGLGVDAKNLLGTVLSAGFDERVVHELGAGVRVTTSRGQVDASARSFARAASERLRAAFDEPASQTGSHA